MRRGWMQAVLTTLAAACASEERGSGLGEVLAIAPAEITLLTDGLTPAEQHFAVTASLADGRTVSRSDASFEVEQASVGRMEGARFISGLIAGETTVRATLGKHSATARVTVRLERRTTIPGGDPLPPATTDLFALPRDPARAPRLVYPNDGVMLPPNLGGLEIHFERAAGTTLFAVRISSRLGTQLAIGRCRTLEGGCLYALEGAEWTALTDAARGGAPLSIEVLGTDDAQASVGVSQPIEVHLAARAVQGGIYYWTTSNGSKIMRVDFGAADRRPEVFFPVRDNNCYGCHAVSPNGRRMSLSERGQWQGQLTLLDVATRQTSLSGDDAFREQFQTWNPSSDRFAGIWGDSNPPDTNIRIRDGMSGRVLETIPLGVEPSHPDWSRRGDRIIFTVVTHHQTSQRPGRGGIAYVEQLAGGGWSAPKMLVEPRDGKNHYYPAYSPDAAFFVYDISTCDGGRVYGDECDADADESAKLHAMLADGGASIALARANAAGVKDGRNTELSNTYPRWAPFVDPRTKDGAGRLMWMSFSSRRHYGLRRPQGNNQLLWMVAVDPDAIAAGRDGSYAAFALPFQDLGTSNHVATWTTQIVPTDPDPGTPRDCRDLGDPCDQTTRRCCSGAICAENGPGVFVCRPDL